MAKNTPAFQFYPADFLIGTALMTAEAVGIYIRLLCYQWTHGGLPNDKKKLANLACVLLEQMDNNWVQISEKFIECEDGFLRNPRLQTIKESMSELSEKRRNAGRKGGQQSSKSSSSFADDLLKQKSSKGRLKNEDRRLKNKEKKKEVESAFDQFWQVYPRKVAKKDAVKAFNAAIDRGIDAETIIAAAKEFSESYAGQQGNYTAYPATWLNAGRWEDDREAWQDRNGTAAKGNGKHETFEEWEKRAERIWAEQDAKKELANE